MRGVKTSCRPRSRSCSASQARGAARTGRMESSHRAVVRITESPNPRALTRYPTLAAGPRTWRTGGLRRRLRKLRLTWDRGVETTRLSSCSTPRPGSWPPPSQPSCLDGGLQPPALLHLRGQHAAAQDHLLVSGLLHGLHLQEPPELLFHAPGSGQLVGGVVGGEYSLQPCPGLRGERSRAAADCGSPRRWGQSCGCDGPPGRGSAAVAPGSSSSWPACTRWNPSTMPST